jgi:hypothetical protein
MQHTRRSCTLKMLLGSIFKQCHGMGMILMYVLLYYSWTLDVNPRSQLPTYTREDVELLQTIHVYSDETAVTVKLHTAKRYDNRKVLVKTYHDMQAMRRTLAVCPPFFKSADGSSSCRSLSETSPCTDTNGELPLTGKGARH